MEPATLSGLIDQLDQTLAALITYLIDRRARPEALLVARSIQSTTAALRVALGLIPGIQ